MTEERVWVQVGRGGEESRGDRDRNPIAKGTILWPPPGWVGETVRVASTVGLLTLALLSSDAGCIQGKHGEEMGGREEASPGARPSCGADAFYPAALGLSPS